MMLVLQSPYPSNQLLQSNLFAEYRFDEGAGQQVFNRVGSSTPSVNLFGAPEQGFSTNSFWAPSGTVTRTDYFATDHLGNNNASRFQCAAGSNFISQFATLATGTYTASLYVKSNTGSAQKMRIFAAPIGWGPDKDITTVWTRISQSFTVTSAGSNQLAFGVDAASEALDILVYGAQVESGSSPTAYVPPVGFDLTLGKTGTADVNDPSWIAAGLAMQGSKYALGLSSAGQSLAQCSLYAVVRWTGTATLTGYAPIIGEDYTNNKLLLAGGDGSGTPVFRFNGNSLTANAANLNDSQWHLMAATYDGSTMRLYMDDTEIASKSATLAAITIQKLFLGTANFAGYFPGDFAYHVAYSTAHSVTQVKQNLATLNALLAGRSISLANVDKFVALEGDSITAANGYSIPGLNAVTPVTQGRLFAVSGSQFSHLTSRAASVDAMVNPARSRNVLTVLIGANDLTGTNGTTYYNSVKTYCLARRAAGWNRIGLITVTPQSNATFNTNRNTYNGLVRGDSSFYDVLIDFAADATMGPDVAGSNVSLYGDGIHPTTAGYAILKPIYTTGLNALLA